MAEKTEQLELSLPYEVIEKSANRAYIRDNFKISGSVAYKIPLGNIQTRGFNPRKIFTGISELAESLYRDKQKTPLELDILPDGRYFLKEGERRYKAFMLLVEQGKIGLDYEVMFEPSKSDATEYSRLMDSYLSNADEFKKPFTYIDNAEVARRFKYCFGEEKTDQQVAEIMHLSRQTITNLISIANAPDDIRHTIISTGMKQTDALELIRSIKAHQKEADKAEIDQNKTSASAASLPQDPLKQELEELKELEQQQPEEVEYDDTETEEAKLAREARERQKMEQLLKVADEVRVEDKILVKYIGKRLAAPACAEWDEDFVDEKSGEVVTVPQKKVVVKENVLIDIDTIKQLIEGGVATCFIYKEITAAPSVITEPVAGEEKPMYDEDRPEIAQIQNAIKLNDRAAVRIEKLDISDGDKRDLLDWLKWQMNDLIEARGWIHKNKKQNKIR